MNEEFQGPDKQNQKTILKDIVDQVKFFYEHAVVFFTKRDFADDVFNTMCMIRKGFRENRPIREIMSIIVDFHLMWLQRVKEIEEFRKTKESYSRDHFYDLVTYTKHTIVCRLKYFHRYLDAYRSTLTNDEQFILRADVEIIGNMHDSVIQKLNEYLLCLQVVSDNREFNLKVNMGIEELLKFLDNIYDKLSMDLGKIFQPTLCNILKRDFQEILDNFVCDTHHPKVTERLMELRSQGVIIENIMYNSISHDNEIDKIILKLNALDAQLIVNDEQEEESGAVLNSILQTTKLYLEKRLNFLEEIKNTLENLNHEAKTKIQMSKQCLCRGFYQFRIFSHVLPHEVRHCLVTKLCSTWNSTANNESHKSILSIYVEPNTKREFTDELGTYFIDEYSRKIYTLPDDNTRYQLNELNTLVPLSDDDDHVYFYDDCGRYYVHSITKQRFYKAFASKSEYTMDTEGSLQKIREERDGVAYSYDSYGRFYLSEEGNKIYREADATSEYENDGFGNLVRLPNILDTLETCPQKANITNECKYLKEAVGPALRKCIVDAILLQPADPIKYLSAALVKYRNNLEMREKKATDNEELMIERKIKTDEEAGIARVVEKDIWVGGSEGSFDSNIDKYQHHSSHSSTSDI